MLLILYILILISRITWGLVRLTIVWLLSFKSSDSSYLHVSSPLIILSLIICEVSIDWKSDQGSDCIKMLNQENPITKWIEKRQNFFTISNLSTTKMNIGNVNTNNSKSLIKQNPIQKMKHRHKQILHHCSFCAHTQNQKHFW